MFRASRGRHLAPRPCRAGAVHTNSLRPGLSQALAIWSSSTGACYEKACRCPSCVGGARSIERRGVCGVFGTQCGPLVGEHPGSLKF